MIANPKSTTEAPPESNRDQPAVEASPFVALAALTHKGVERLAEMQKLTLDLAARQTSDTVKTLKMATKPPFDGPWASLLDFTGQSVEKMAQTQKGILDLVTQQSASVVELAKTRTDSMASFANNMADMLNATTDRIVTAQRMVLDFAAEQNKAAADAMKQQTIVSSSAPAVAAVETIQRNVEVAIQTQKEMVQAAARPMKTAAASPAA